MAHNDLNQRQQRYFQLSSDIAQLDNTHLLAPFDSSVEQAGWGRNQKITVRDETVFIKRIPVTTIEYDHMFSTANLYHLPTFYQYRFGSVGLSVFRELVTHIKTTNWVLAGAIETFPLLYHYRIIPTAGAHVNVDMAYHKRNMAYWGENANVGRYLLDRANAPYELILYLEHIPHTVATWLRSHQSHIPMVMADMHTTTTFLRNHGIIHLDNHFLNMLTDGQRAYLTDFGLALDKKFALTPAEMHFYEQHTEYDYGNLLWSLGTHIVGMYRDLSEADKQRIDVAYQINNDMVFEELMTLLLTHIDEIAASGMIKLEQSYVTSIAQYRPVITFMHDFYTAMRRNNQKDTHFQQTMLRQLLLKTGFVPSNLAKNLF